MSGSSCARILEDYDPTDSNEYCTTAKCGNCETRSVRVAIKKGNMTEDALSSLECPRCGCHAFGKC